MSLFFFCTSSEIIDISKQYLNFAYSLQQGKVQSAYSSLTVVRSQYDCQR